MIYRDRSVRHMADVIYAVQRVCMKDIKYADLAMRSDWKHFLLCGLIGIIRIFDRKMIWNMP